jgi:hypothetical protein
MIDLQQAWEILGGGNFVREAIEKAREETGIVLTPDVIETVVQQVGEQIPGIIEEVEQQAAQNMARDVARREYQRFCRAAGIRPNSQFL